MPNCRTITLCKQKGGVGIPRAEPGDGRSFRSTTSPSATKRKRRNHKGYTVSENLLT